MADRLPTPTATLIGTTLLSLATGYVFGHLIGNPFAAAPPPAPKSRADTSHYDDEEESSEEEIDDGVVIDHAPNWANGAEADRREGLRASARAAEEGGVTADWDLGEECKMVLVVRTDLGMTKGRLPPEECEEANMA
jgi:PTH2 family peptidyl-tRNA hydrolase